MDDQVLKIIADNPILSKALRSVFEKQFELGNLAVTDDDAVLGQVVRARLVGMRGIADVFREIEKFKSTSDGASRINPAR